MVDLKPDEKQEKEELDAIFKSEPKKYNPVEFEEDEEDAAGAGTASHPWENRLVQVIIAIVVIVLLVFGGRWLHHQLNHKNTATKAPSTTQTVSQPGSKPQSGSNSTSASTTPTQTGSNVPNTGPGSTLVIFLSATFAAAILHFAVSKRRA